jgi:SAM-dependent methyltransferase
VIASFSTGDYAVEIGARAGGLSLLFALNGVRTFCTDIDDPYRHSGSVHDKYEESRYISYIIADATNLPFGAGKISLVGSKSVLGSIARDGQFARAQRAVNEAHRVLQPGGVFIFAENLRASRLHRALRRKFVPWAKHYYYFSPPELDKLLSGFSEVKYFTRGLTALAGRSERQRRALAKFDRVIHPLTPRGWRYLAYGYARK